MTGRNLPPAAILIATLCLGGSLSARSLDVCAQCEIQSLRAGIKAAAPGDTIRLHAGIYSEGLIEVFKPLRIIGQGRPVVDGLKQGHVFYIRADDVVLSGLVIRSSGMSFVSDFAGIRAEHSKRCLFEDNHLENNTYSVYFEKVSDCTISNNRINGNAVREVSAGNGIHLFYSDHIRVLDNDITRSRDGIYFEFTEDTEVRGNHSHGNLRFGMHFMFSHRNSFTGNRFVDNPTGVAIMYSRHLLVEGNRFEKSRGASSYGILIKEITDSVFRLNQFRLNTLGIMLNGSNRNRFERNDFVLNGWAAEIFTNSYGNSFRNNNFIDNQFDIATNSTRNESHFENNHWDRYRGYDLDRDGRGDVPFRPVSVFSFWVGRFPELGILLNSPVVRFLDMAERVFPAMTPKTLTDPQPLMKPAHTVHVGGTPDA